MTDPAPVQMIIPPPGASGWWLCEIGSKRVARLMHNDGWTFIDSLMGWTYDPAEVLAWARDGVLPDERLPAEASSDMSPTTRVGAVFLDIARDLLCNDQFVDTVKGKLPLDHAKGRLAGARGLSAAVALACEEQVRLIYTGDVADAVLEAAREHRDNLSDKLGVERT